uniref:Uncharacterized mitochondrial protein AtMg00810-like n=1 Tax=Tanacetum cinerariifolium TaxID=118510 RepID=A0A6L2KLY1_TANCI|nr:uncharacterized mitochondrial protein AtMg00810-like [Tanacetum cinerariifolium]
MGPNDKECDKHDNLIKLWIYKTISKALVTTILKKNLKVSDVWKNLKVMFYDNKDVRAMQLDIKLRNISNGNLSITQYFTKIKDMSDLLANIEAPVSEKSLVTYAINGLVQVVSVVQIVTTVSIKVSTVVYKLVLLARKNKLKARGTMLMALPDKHELKLNIHKYAKTLMEAIKKRFEGNKETKKVQKTLLKHQYKNFIRSSSESLDQIHDRLQKLISRLEILGESLSQEDINLNTTEPISAAASVSAVSVKIPVSALPNVDTLIRARRFLHRTRRNLGANRPTSIGFDMAKVECYNCYRKGHFARECRSPKDTRRNGATEPQRRNAPVETSTSNALVFQCDGVGSYEWSFQTEEEPTDYALMAFTSSGSSFDNELRDSALVVLRQNLKKVEQEKDDLKLKLENNESLPPSPIYDRYQSGNGYHVVTPPYIGTFMPPKPDLVFHNAPNVNETVHTAFNFELSPTKPDKDLSPTPRPLAPIIEDWVSDLEDDSKTKSLENPLSFVHPNEHIKPPRPSVKHVETSILAATPKTAIPKPTSHGNSKNRKACFVYKSLTHLIKDCDFYEKKMAQTTARNHAKKGNHQQYARMKLPNPQRYVVPTAVLTQSKLVPITAVRPVTTVVPNTNVTRPRQAKTVVTMTNSPPRRHINYSPSPKASTFPLKVTAVKDLMDKGVIYSGCSRYMIGNMSYLSDFEELNGRYVAFGGNPKGGKISGKGKIRTGKLDFDDVYFFKELKFNFLPDENQVLLRVPRENNMYNVNLKNIVPSGDLTFLFAKATLDESHLWHRRLGHINFKTMNKLVKGNNVRGLPSKVFKNDHTCVACKKGKQHRAFCKTKSNTDRDATFDEKEPEFEGRKPESKVNVSPSSKFEDFSDNSINEDNVAGTLVLGIGQISTTSTNSFSDVGPSNAVVSSIQGKYAYVDSSQLPDDPNKPEIEIYVDDIIFGSTNKDLCQAFKKLMKDKFQMSSMGELKFFLSLQVKQKKDRIFIRQDKYVAEILKKFGLTDGKSASTPIYTEKPLLKDPDGEDVDVHTYRSMIGSLMYLTLSRPDIMFTVCACAHFQVTPKASNLHEVKRIFRYLKGKPHLGLWYPKDSPFNLVAYSDSDYAGTNLDRKSTIGGCQFLGCRLISWQCKKQTVVATSSTEAEYIAAMVNDVTRLQALVDKKMVILTEATIRDNLQLDDVEGIDCLPNEEIFTELARMGGHRRMSLVPLWHQLSSAFPQTQVCDLSLHSTKYSSLTLTQKVFTNMRREGKGCSDVETPLFEGMVVAQQVGEGAAEVNVDDVPAIGVANEGAASVADDVVPTDVEDPSIPSLTPPTLPPQPSQDIPSTLQVYLTLPQSPQAQPQSPQQQPQPSQDAKISMDLLHNLLDTCTTLTRRVENLEHDKIA